MRQIVSACARGIDQIVGTLIACLPQGPSDGRPGTRGAIGQNRFVTEDADVTVMGDDVGGHCLVGQGLKGERYTRLLSSMLDRRMLKVRGNFLVGAVAQDQGNASLFQRGHIGRFNLR